MQKNKSIPSSHPVNMWNIRLSLNPRNPFNPSFLFGFTLIELLVVILILGILVAIAVPQYQLALYQSRYNTLKNLTNSIAQAEELHYLENGTYSSDFRKLALQMPADRKEGGGNATYTYDWGSCTTQSNTSQSAVVCRNSFTGMAYQIFLQHSAFAANKKLCAAPNTDLNSLQNKICKKETKGVGVGNTKLTWYYQ